MMPVVFRIPFIDKDIPSYGLMMMIGFLVSIMWAARRASRSGADPDVILNCGFVALIAGVVGSRAMYVFHYWSEFAHRGSAWQVAWAVVDVSKGGLEFYGGFILSAVAVVFYLWRWGHSLRWYLDIIAPSVALGMAFGRIGCLLNGCCYGTVCDLPWKVQFPYGSLAAMEQWRGRLPGAELPAELLYLYPSGLHIPIQRESLAASDAQIAAAEAAEAAAYKAEADAQAEYDRAPDGPEKQRLLQKLKTLKQKTLVAAAKYGDIRAQMKKYNLGPAELRALAGNYRSLPVHPAQLYSTVALALLALLLNAVYWRRTRDGQVVCTLFLIEPISRWMLELLRADNPRDVLGLTISQKIAICLTALGLIGFVVLRRLPPRSRRARLWEPPAPDKAKGRSKSKRTEVTA